MKIKIIINFKKIIWTSKIDMGMLLLRTSLSITNFKMMAHPTHLKFLELWEARFGNYSFLIYTISPHLPTLKSPDQSQKRDSLSRKYRTSRSGRRRSGLRRWVKRSNWSRSYQQQHQRHQHQHQHRWYHHHRMLDTTRSITRSSLRVKGTNSILKSKLLIW